MHYRIENPTHGTKLSLPPGTAKEVSHEEMTKIADVVARLLAPVAQRLVTYTDASGQPATRGEMGPATNRPRIHCYLVDEGKDQELSSKDLLAVYAEDIKARAAARKAPAKKK